MLPAASRTSRPCVGRCDYVAHHRPDGGLDTLPMSELKGGGPGWLVHAQAQRGYTSAAGITTVRVHFMT